MRAVHHGNLSKHLKQKYCPHEFNCNRTNLGNTKEKYLLSHSVTNLHANDSVDEEQHGYQESNIWQSLQAEEREESRKQLVTLIISSITDQIIVLRLTWKDLMKVQSRVRMPSPLLRSLTRRMTRNRRKKVMEIRALSSVFCGEPVQSQRPGEQQCM